MPGRRRRANGDGSISKPRKDGRREVKLTINGERRTVGYARDIQGARELLKRAIRERDDGRLMAGRGPTVAQYLKYWLEHVKAPVLREQSYRSYVTRMNDVYRHIGETPLAKLAAPDVRTCYTALLEDGQSARTIQLTHVVLKAALSHASREGVIGRNPMDAVDPPRGPRFEGDRFTLEEVQRVFRETGDDPLHALWILLFTTGLRIGEALALRWEDIADDSLVVEHTVNVVPAGGLRLGPPKTEGSRRRVDLPPVARGALSQHGERQVFIRRSYEQRTGQRWEDPRLVFPNTTGGIKSPGAAHHAWTVMLRRLELRHRRLHDTRHSLASILAEHGTHIQVIQGVLGHADIGTTLREYSHLSPTARKRVVGEIETLFGGGHDQVQG